VPGRLHAARAGAGTGDRCAQKFRCHGPSLRDGVAPDGAPRVLENHEHHRAVLISHSRRDPAALNATYALISALRVGQDALGVPFSRHCHVDSRRVELWTDKEQLAEKGHCK
jgi:hypothetical protein